jgi:arginase
MKRFYLHLDLDALDPSEGRANGYAAKGGFTNQNLQRVLALAARNLPIEAMTIAGYDPSHDSEKKVCAIALEAAGTSLGQRA